MSEYYCEMTWNRPCLEALPLPAFVACILALEPICYHDARFDGIPSCKKPVKPIFATHDNTEKSRAITIGQAMDSSNTLRDITIGEEDIRRHWQIIGQTGTGKSTLLATSIISAIKQGYGLTFFDPHGTTIDIIKRSLPKEFIDRVNVIHIGDDENPVPLSLWSSGDPEAEERTISELCALFMEIFDPYNQGIAGPRWERWFTTFAKAALAFFGRFASFESIVALSQSRESMRMLYDTIKHSHPSIAAAVENEFGKDESKDFNALIGWAVSKLQRFTSISQLRKTLGAGINALDYAKAIDTDSVFLIDLAMPEIGKNAARIVGTMILLQLWQAALTRKHRELTHLVFLDESQLFQSSPLPFMLAEGRKFGLGVIMAHQHCRQMSQEILDALEANSANFTSFRLSSHDAAVAAVRLDDSAFASKLCRIDAFNAITTLSVDGNQSDVFTLKISPVQEEALGEEYAKTIEQQSYARLVRPFLNQRALTQDEIEERLRRRQVVTLDDGSSLTSWRHSKSSKMPPPRASGIAYVSENQLGAMEKLASGE